MEHLALEIFDLKTKDNPNPTGSQYANLPEDASITITDTSEIFASGDVWSHSFTLNIPANLHIFGTSGDIHGSRLHEQINKRKACLWVEGLPLHLGYLKLDDEVEVDENGNVDVTFESGQLTFDEKIEGAKANQVPLIGDVLIGMALWRKRWVNYAMEMKANVEFADGHSNTFTIKQGDKEYVKFETEGEADETPTQQYPRMVYPKAKLYDRLAGAWDTYNYLNTDSPYMEDENGTPTHPYCNVALCYQKYGYEKKNDNGELIPDYNSEPEAQRGYEMMPANRVNSAPNFYVAYWVRCLMKKLGIYIEENQMLDLEDLRRLFFVNTNCAYEEPKKMRTATDYSRYGKYTSFVDRGTTKDYVGEYAANEPFVEVKESGFTCTSFEGDPSGQSYAEHLSGDEKTVEKVTVVMQGVKVWGNNQITPNPDGNLPDYSDYLGHNRYFHKAYATSDCFPNVDISEVISALENGFGIRFLFSDNYQRVRIVLLRNVFRNEDVQDIKCEIVEEDVKVENSIRGFRLTYGESEDTHFYYKGFADKLPHKAELWPDTSDTHDYSQWNLNSDYGKIIQKASAFDKVCYVTPNTGNAYGIKIDKDAKRYEELHPSIFEFAGFMDAEDGDCTGEEDTIHTINMGFTPAIMNDLNMEQERNGDTSQRFALFVDETMRPRRPDLGKRTAPDSYNDSDAEYIASNLYVNDSDFSKMKSGDYVQPGLFAIKSDMFAKATGVKTTVSRKKYISYGSSGGNVLIRWDLTLNLEGHINEGYRLYLQDNFEPNDEGISPIETHDWGLTLGIMRGSGSDAYVDYTPDNDDGEGNDTWNVVSGSNATAHPDTCDNYGNLWDYNGSDGQTIHCTTAAEAINAMQRLWPNSNIDLIYKPNTSGRTQAVPDYRDTATYIKSATIQTITNNYGNKVSLLFATATNSGNLYPNTVYIRKYAKKFNGMTATQMKAFDAGSSGFGILVEVDSSMERMRTLLSLQELAFHNGDAVILDGGDNGVGVTEGRFSLKLRAEKLNPYYVEGSTDTDKKDQYLTITNKNLRGRGLADQLYKEYSYWIRNARIVKRTVRMTLAQLLTIDKTVRVTVGDVTGFIRKMQYSVSNKTGLGNVTMEIMYI